MSFSGESRMSETGASGQEAIDLESVDLHPLRQTIPRGAFASWRGRQGTQARRRGL